MVTYEGHKGSSHVVEAISTNNPRNSALMGKGALVNEG